ncbi:MAG: hypothetical protein ACJAR0_003578 [Candidatus Azotimanducaceae bacterium]
MFLICGRGLFSPPDFVAKLAALVPRPRHHLLRYHGILVANARLRRYVVPAPTRKRQKGSGQCPRSLNEEGQPRAPLNWAERLKRVFETGGAPPDITKYANCVGRLRVIALVTNPIVIDKILKHVTSRSPPPSLNSNSAVLF